MKQLKDLKNAIVYRVKPDFKFTPELLAEFEKMAEESHFDGVEMRSGILRQDCFVRPVNDKFIHTIENKTHYVQMKKVVRQIPGKVVQRELKKRVAEYFEKEGKSATKSMKTDMKHDIIEDLSVSAFKLDSYIDVIFTDDFVIVGAGSAKAADDVFTSMRKCFGTLQAVCLGAATKNAMSPVVTKDIHAALLNEESEEIKSLGFDVGDAIGLEGSGQWGGKDIALDSGVLLAAFDANMSVGKAQLCGDDLHFDLTEELHMKAIGFSNVMQFQAIENTEDQTQQIETNITLAYAAITAAVMKVVDGLGGWYDEEQS
ncbi:exonuclease recombination-associated [Vibrio phage 1254]|nr:hypothetical protein SIPHO017v1_p0012 [Vibrio phage 19E33.1]QZI92782.1 hypothetical protein SIPHO016v1_p0003 [Vibrio phage 38E33.6a]QZI92970.1 hypothetical protein SIPHO015v1_p0032 [Vibrio phage 82E32.2]QZI93011.1 hypothetical protein SIPHO014v1_p0012 [Vibrio phage 82E32.3]QZI93122.1 hypothetical protein SIPHO013v1_p0061 [Vibrio phage 82E33.2]